MAPLYQNGICTHWPTGIPFFPLKKRKRTLRTAGTRDRTPWFVTRGRQLRENSLPFRPRDNQLNDNDPVQRRLLPSFLSYFLLSSSKKALDWDVLLLFYFQRERDGSLVHVRRDIRVLCFLASIDLLDPMRVRNTPTPSLPRHTLFARIALINHLLPAGTLCGRDTYWIPPGNNKHKTKEKERRKLFCNH